MQIRLSFEEKVAIEKRAKDAGVTPSEFVRAKALGYSPANPKRPVPAEEVRGILKDPENLETESDFIARFVRENRNLPKATAERQARSAWKASHAS